MWIVRLALEKKYIIAVMALLVVIMGGLSIRQMPTDIFPRINIPVVSVLWGYTGLSTDEMEKTNRAGGQGGRRARFGRGPWPGL